MKSHDKRLLALALAVAVVVERVVWLSISLCKVTVSLSSVSLFKDLLSN